MEIEAGDIVKTIEAKVNTNKGCIGIVKAVSSSSKTVELDWLFHNNCPNIYRFVYIFNLEDLKKMGKLTGLLYGVNYAKK